MAGVHGVLQSQQDAAAYSQRRHGHLRVGVLQALGDLVRYEKCLRGTCVRAHIVTSTTRGAHAHAQHKRLRTCVLALRSRSQNVARSSTAASLVRKSLEFSWSCRARSSSEPEGDVLALDAAPSRTRRAGREAALLASASPDDVDLVAVDGPPPPALASTDTFLDTAGFDCNGVPMAAATAKSASGTPRVNASRAAASRRPSRLRSKYLSSIAPARWSCNPPTHKTNQRSSAWEAKGSDRSCRHHTIRYPNKHGLASFSRLFLGILNEIACQRDQSVQLLAANNL